MSRSRAITETLDSETRTVGHSEPESESISDSETRERQERGKLDLPFFLVNAAATAAGAVLLVPLLPEPGARPQSASDRKGTELPVARNLKPET